MAESAGKAVYRRFVEEVINTGDIDVIPEIFHPDYVDHSAPPGAGQGQSVYEQIAGIPRMFRGAFPDVHFTIESMVEEGDWVGTRVTGEGHHSGTPFMGIEPSGRAAVWTSFGLFRIADGRIVEHYGQPDLPGLREQITGAAGPTGQDDAKS